MRVLLTTVDLPGHVDLVLPLAQALRARHDVVFAVGPAQVGTIEQAGITAVTVGGGTDHQPDHEGECAMVARCAELTALLAGWRADVVVRDQLDLGAWAAARAGATPDVACGLGAAHVDLTASDPGLVERLWATSGAGPLVHGGSIFGQLFVHLAPESLDPWLSPVPSIRCRPSVPTAQAPLPPRPPALDGAGDRPVVLVTLDGPDRPTLDVVVEALAGLDVHPVLAAAAPGGTSGLADVRHDPGHAAARATLLAHCDAVVCDGGFATVIAALSLGIPLALVLPVADRAISAHRLRDLGVAEIADDGGVTVAGVRRALRQVLEDAVHGDRAAAVRDDILSLPTLEAAVDRIERLGEPVAP